MTGNLLHTIALLDESAEVGKFAVQLPRVSGNSVSGELDMFGVHGLSGHQFASAFRSANSRELVVDATSSGETDFSLFADSHQHAYRSNEEQSFTPTRELLEQSRLNELESRLMASQSLHPSPPGRPRFDRMRSTIDQQIHRGTNRRTSVVEVVDQSAPPETMPSSPIFTEPASISSPLSRSADDRSRQLRMTRNKFVYSSTDDLRLEASHQQLVASRADASPGALYVTTRQAGVLSEVFECHGFCYSTPVNVRISTYPISEEDSDTPQKSQKPWITVSKALSKENLSKKWSKFCMQSHGVLLYCPLVPFHRMLKLRQSDFFLAVDSGDILLEGSSFHCKSQYIQYKTRSICSHVSVIYKDPNNGILYALTSRQWSRSLIKEVGEDNTIFDLNTFKRIDGVQMHPLDDYIRMQRKRGVYFICRRLQKGRRRPYRSERATIGNALYNWYEEHHGAKFPDPPEVRARLAAATCLEMKSDLSSKSRKLIESPTYSSSQVVLEAMQCANILDPRTSKERAIFSIPGYFEQKGVKFAPNQGNAAWNLEVLSLIVGDTTTQQSNGTYGLGNLRAPEIVRYVESGAV